MKDMHLEPGFNDKKELVEISLVSGKPPFGPVVEVNKDAPIEDFPYTTKSAAPVGKIFQPPRIERGPKDKKQKISKVDRTKFKKVDNKKGVALGFGFITKI